MPAKPKRRREDRSPDLRHRAARAVTSHPWWSLGTLISVIAILPTIAAALAWAFGFIETTATADRREAKLHGEILTLKADTDAHKISDARTSAWAYVQSLKNEQMALRNRVNDCDIKKDKRESMTSLERGACTQYQQEFDDATRRYNDARATATATAREK